MITAPSSAPAWAHDLAKSVDGALDRNIWPWISRRTYTVTQLTGTPGATLAATYPFMLARVSNGAGNKYVAISNGVAFYYLEGTAV